MQSCFGCVQPFVNLWSVAHQTPLSAGILLKNTGVGHKLPSSRGSSQQEQTYHFLLWQAGFLTTRLATSEALINYQILSYFRCDIHRYQVVKKSCTTILPSTSKLVCQNLKKYIQSCLELGKYLSGQRPEMK